MNSFFQNPLKVPLKTRLPYLVGALLIINLLALLAPYHWLADLFTHFRYQYLAASAVLLLATLTINSLRHKKTALLLTALLIYNALLTFQTILPAPQKPPANNAQTYTLFFQNVLVSNPQHQEIIAEIEAHDPDLIWLAEVSPTFLQALQPLANAYPHRHNNPKNHGFGNLLWSKHPLTAHRQIVPQHLDHFIIQLPHSQPLHLLGTHPLPPISKQANLQRNHTIAKIPLTPHIPTLLCGDFNATPWSTPMKTLLKTHPTLRYANRGQLPRATWQSIPFLTSIPIDHTLHTPQIHIHEFKVGPHNGSDHRPLITTFSIHRKQLDSPKKNE